MPGVERLAGRDGQRHPDALATLHAQQMGPDSVLLRRPRLLACFRPRLRMRRLGHGRRAMAGPHQTFRLSNGNRISIAILAAPSQANSLQTPRVQHFTDAGRARAPN